jgi:hypothetical protein
MYLLCSQVFPYVLGIHIHLYPPVSIFLLQWAVFLHGADIHGSICDMISVDNDIDNHYLPCRHFKGHFQFNMGLIAPCQEEWAIFVYTFVSMDPILNN